MQMKARSRYFHFKHHSRFKSLTLEKMKNSFSLGQIEKSFIQNSFNLFIKSHSTFIKHLKNIFLYPKSILLLTEVNIFLVKSTYLKNKNKIVCSEINIFLVKSTFISFFGCLFLQKTPSSAHAHSEQKTRNSQSGSGKKLHQRQTTQTRNNSWWRSFLLAARVAAGRASFGCGSGTAWLRLEKTRALTGEWRGEFLSGDS